MKEHPDSTATERFDELAAAYFSDTLTAEESEEFLRTIRDSNSCTARFDTLQTAYARSFVPRFESVRKENYRTLFSRRTTADPVRLRIARIRRTALHAAAVVAIALTTLTSVYYISCDIAAGRLAGEQITELTVPLGSQLRVQLPDKSVAWLNSGSVLRYDRNFGRKMRQVELSGEAYFEVQPDADRPFEVRTDEMNVRVLGTVFNIRDYADDPAASLNLLEGSVSLTASRSGRNVVLKPDQCGMFDKASGLLTVRPADARKAAQWTVGKLSFVNTPLPQLLRVIERHYDVKIAAESSRIAEERFSGSVSLSLSLDEILDYVDVDSKYARTRQGNKIVLTDK